MFGSLVSLIHLFGNRIIRANTNDLVWRRCAAVGCVARRASVVWIVLIVAVNQGRDASEVKIGWKRKGEMGCYDVFLNQSFF
jgi:hypothetical protein